MFPVTPRVPLRGPFLDVLRCLMSPPDVFLSPVIRKPFPAFDGALSRIRLYRLFAEAYNQIRLIL